MAWSRSDTFALVALLVSGGTLLIQFLDRGMPYRVQAYIDKTQAADKIVQSVENPIQARQLAMISVGYNIYEPQWAMRYPLERMNADAKEATPIVNAFASFNGTLQNNMRYFKDPETMGAFENLEVEAGKAVHCFTEVASARHDYSPEQLQSFRTSIARLCNGANIPGSLDALKAAEARAMSAMEAERVAAGGKR